MSSTPPGSIGSVAVAAPPAASPAVTASGGGAASALDGAIALVSQGLATTPVAELPARMAALNELVTQRERMLQADHARWIGRWDLVGQYSISAVAIVAGAGLAALGVGPVAYFLVGGGLYGVVPKFVTDFYKTTFGNG